MKKLHFLSVLILAAVLSAPAFAASGGLEVKAGAASVKGSGDKIGFDAGVAYAIRLDRFFAIVPEVNFNWLSYTGASGAFGSGGFTGPSAPSTNVYTLPMMLNGRLYIPMGGDDTPIFQPFVSVGAGYGISSYVQSSTPTSSANTATASGFMYQVAVGGLLNMGMIADGSASSTNVLLEVGYRGGILSTSDSRTMDYGGFLVRAGFALSF